MLEADIAASLCHLASVRYREANLPGLNNCLLIVQKVRVGVAAETQNLVITNSTDAQKKVA